jgi:hypothetical protein
MVPDTEPAFAHAVYPIPPTSDLVCFHKLAASPNLYLELHQRFIALLARIDLTQCWPDFAGG